MPPAFVQTNKNSASGTSVTVTLPSNTAGNLLVLGVETANANNKITVSDSAGNVWQTAAFLPNASGWRNRIFYVENCKASAGTNTVTVTLATSTSNRVIIAEYSGVATSGAFSNCRSANGSSGTASSGSFAVTNGDLIVAFSFMLGGSIAAGTGYTGRAGPDLFAILEDKVTSSTSETATTTGTSNGWTICAVAFHPTSPASTAPYVQGDISGSVGQTTESAVFPSNTAGNALIAVVEYTSASAGTVSLADTAANTWSLLGFVNGPSSNYQLAIYLVSSCASSSGQNKVTVTSTTTGNLRIAIAEYTITSTAVKGVAYNWIASATSISTAIALPASLNAVIIACPFNVPAASYGSPGAGYALRKTFEDGIMFLMDKASSAAETPSDSTSGAGEKSIVAISLGQGPVNGNNPIPLGAILQSGMVGVAYSETLTTQGGDSPYTYTVSTGALPTGLSLSSGGVISGTPSASGTFSFGVQVTDNNGTTNTEAFQIIISPHTEFSSAFAG